MSKLEDCKFYHNALKSAKSRSKDYRNKKKHNYDLYNFRAEPKSKTLGQSYQPETFNQVYGIIETQKAGLGFKYPKISVKAKRPYFYSRKVRGNRDIELTTKSA